ncbi:hypothetical protein EMCRGX_G004152 [Ephydatia muelleri]
MSAAKACHTPAAPLAGFKVQQIKDPLNALCKNETIFEMSHVPFDWKSVGIHLLGTESFWKIDQELLGALNEQEKKISILHMWLEKAQAKATYRVLVELFESMRNTAAANAVRKLATLHSADGGHCIVAKRVKSDFRVV